MDPTVITALEALQDLKVAELKKRYRELFGEESKSSNKQYLFRRIAWRLQANAEGDLSERARRREEELASRGERRARQDLLHEILRRDQLDTERAVSPLKAAEDAFVVQTDGLSVREALDKVLAAIQRP